MEMDTVDLVVSDLRLEEELLRKWRLAQAVHRLSPRPCEHTPKQARGMCYSCYGKWHRRVRVPRSELSMMNA